LPYVFGEVVGISNEPGSPTAIVAAAYGPPMRLSYVVTGGGRGIGRAIVHRLAGHERTVVVIERDEEALGWAGDGVVPVIGDASDEAVAARAADAAQAAGTLAGWVNNAAVFRDASVHTSPV